MIDALLRTSIARRWIVMFLVGAIAALGIWNYQRLPIDAVPDITNVQIQVLTKAPSLGPVDVERTITFPIESSMSGLPELSEVRSVSRFGLSAVTVVFEEDTDLLRARQLVSERLTQARERLPPGVTPDLGPMSSGLGEILQFEVRSDRLCAPGEPDTEDCHTAMELRVILDWFVAYELRSVSGVVEVNSFGGELKTYEVEVLPDRLRALNVSLSELFVALERNNATAGGGYLVRAGEQLLVRGEGRIQGLDEIGDVLIETREDGVPVRVRDVARVHFAPLIRQGAVTRDGRGEVVTGIVMMLVGANGREVVENVKARIAEIEPSLPPGVRLDVFYDRGTLVNRTIKTVATNLAEGALFVIAVLFLLLGSIRGAGANNLVIVGSPTWSQDVDVAANNPITQYQNVAYTLHFYAATHKQFLRDKANTALGRGLALFVTEWGTCSADGNGSVDANETNTWLSWMDQNSISWANWSLFDKNEACSALFPGTSATGPWPDGTLTASGMLVRPKITEKGF